MASSHGGKFINVGGKGTVVPLDAEKSNVGSDLFAGKPDSCNEEIVAVERKPGVLQKTLQNPLAGWQWLTVLVQ